MEAVEEGEEAAAERVAQWERSRPSGVSKLDLTTIWGHDRTPLATATSASAAGALCALGISLCTPCCLPQERTNRLGKTKNVEAKAQLQMTV